VDKISLKNCQFYINLSKEIFFFYLKSALTEEQYSNYACLSKDNKGLNTIKMLEFIIIKFIGGFSNS
jgi:hypothetical protein